MAVDVLESLLEEDDEVVQVSDEGCCNLRSFFFILLFIVIISLSELENVAFCLNACFLFCYGVFQTGRGRYLPLP